ncbi:DUF1772 domain-containing protein [Labedaea rhizosphaerae]|uniref:Putative membrane protein n=1 Tax=Labedaea rhizosphaerae TaxID=598644 RepID=A0A4R6SFH6_LABRH|nr:anthrone oxygenase family protein [Labedaea rhizosphaerae]TDP97846.1 putative membrane protein [Labedaea rhizosphaerae]
MVTGLTYAGTVVGATGSAVIGGLLFAFSTAVMPALRKQPAGEGMRAMQQVNRLIQNPVFLLVFVGTGLVCLALAIGTLFADQPHEVLRAIGALLYVVGAFGVTAVVNVPLNNALDRHRDDEAGHAYWAEFLAKWVPWNHLRTVAAIAGTVLMILSLG